MLSAILGISLTGLQAAKTRLAVTAHNISNMNTDGFKASVANDSDQPDGLGVRTTITRSNQAAPAVRGEDGKSRTLSNTDITHEMTQLIIAKRSYEANLKALKAADKLEDETIDLMG